jgi:hypothetical protein
MFDNSPQSDQIAALAYELWQSRGCPEGSPEEDWFRAEDALVNRSEFRRSEFPQSEFRVDLAA